MGLLDAFSLILLEISTRFSSSLASELTCWILTINTFLELVPKPALVLGVGYYSRLGHDA